MLKQVDEELIKICRNIINTNKSIEEWKKIEACDYFQESSYVGGFDSTENAFCFSYYNEEANEFWFQLTMEEIKKIVDGKMNFLQIRPTDN